MADLETALPNRQMK